MKDISEFTDAELNIGKILVLEMGHGQSESDIKGLTHAATVRKINVKNQLPSASMSVYLMLQQNIMNARIAMRMKNAGLFDIYYVSGNNVNLTGLLLKQQISFIALEIDTAMMQELCNENRTYCLIYETRCSMLNAADDHDQLIDFLSKRNISNSLGNITETLHNLAKSYADDQLQRSVSAIEDIMKSSWKHDA
uniref:hypothetical protein n=1 Tax=Polaromonas sp. E3S TaxID=1840265 RepID=UPI0015E7EB07|nr:hypothetical protein [Polaromonas sp. E3S]